MMILHKTCSITQSGKYMCLFFTGTTMRCTQPLNQDHPLHANQKQYEIANNNNIKIYFKYFRRAVAMAPVPLTRSCSTP